MTAGEWERIKSLFDAALNVRREERSAWLEEACSGCPELRDTLEQLLRSYDESSSSDPRDLEPEPVFCAGQVVANRFRILRLIARGGMGEVYEATDASLNGLRVALKTIRTKIASERHAYERFKREVWVAREMADDGICRIYDLVEHRETGRDGIERVIPCLTMQLLDGRTLASVLEARRPLQPGEALPLIRQVVRSLELMHAKGIVHRDFKPSNIMLVNGENGCGGRAVLMDFGLAKPLSGRSQVWETRTDDRAGAPYFVAPEVLRGEKGGTAVDVYSLGLVIDEMVTRSPAFPNTSIEELFWKKLHADPIPPSQRSQGLPPGWEQTILQCLERDPEQRPRSAAEVLRSLEEGSAGLATTVGEPPPVRLGKRRPARTTAAARLGVWLRRWWPGAAAALVLGLILWALIGGGPAPIHSSILVFPISNLTRNPDYEYLCVGTVDELMRRLIYIDGLKVLPVREARNPRSPGAREARFSLEGNLQQHESRVRLTVQLIENETGALAWSEYFENELRDPLALESDIAEKVVAALSLRVQPEGGLGPRIQLAAFGMGAPVRRLFKLPSPQLPAPATASGSAFEEYLRGRQLWRKRTLPETLNAIEHYKRAVARDPRFALAYAALADAQHTLLSYNHGDTPELLKAAREYAERAVELDPSLPETHSALAGARQLLWDWQGAEASYRNAIEKQPKFAQAYWWYGGLVLQFGRFDEALAQTRRAIELDPYEYPAQSAYGLFLWEAGRFREAAAQLESVAAKSDLRYAHFNLSQAYSSLAAATAEPEATAFYVNGLREAGIVRTRELEEAGGADGAGFLKWSDIAFAMAHAARGDRASARVYTDRLEYGLKSGKVSASAVAWAQAAAGNRRRTLELLEIGVERREREMFYVKVNPLFRPLHGEPRFQAVLRRMGL